MGDPHLAPGLDGDVAHGDKRADSGAVQERNPGCGNEVAGEELVVDIVFLQPNCGAEMAS
jgi:hypothetical protein